MSLNKPNLIVFLLILMACLGPMSMDIYIPSSTIIMNFFSVSYAQVQLSIALFMVGFGAFQVIYGPLSDRFGRKPILLGGMCIYLLGSVLCSVSPSIDILNLGRLIQGIGACGSAVTAFAVARDLFSGKESLKIFSKISAAIGFVPVLAPVFGAYLQYVFGWRSNFVFLFSFGILIIISTYFYLRETNENRGHENTKFKNVMPNYKHLLSNRKYLIFSFCSMLAFGALLSFVSNAPYYLNELAGVSINFFTVLFSINALAFISGAMSISKLAAKFSVKKLIFIGAFLLLTGGALQTFLLIIFSINPFFITLPMLLCTFGIAMMLPTTISASLQPFPEIAGSASGLGGFIRFLGGAGISTIVAYAQNDFLLALPLEMLLSGLLIIYLMRKN